MQHHDLCSFDHYFARLCWNKSSCSCSRTSSYLTPNFWKDYIYQYLTCDLNRLKFCLEFQGLWFFSALQELHHTASIEAEYKDWYTLDCIVDLPQPGLQIIWYKCLDFDKSVGLSLFSESHGLAAWGHIKTTYSIDSMSLIAKL